jgi:hypothetical protein
VPLAGVIGCGGRLVGDELKDARYPHFGAAGMADFNYVPMREIDEQFARNGAPHRFEPFPGGHQWLPQALAAAAVEWMDIIAMKQGAALPMAVKNFPVAVLLLSVAEHVQPRNFNLKYNLARTYAIQGDRRRALATLRRAVDGGFRDANRIRTWCRCAAIPTPGS